MTQPFRSALSAALFTGLLVVTLGLPALTRAADVKESLKAIRAVDKEGKGQAEAQRAMRVLTDADARDLPVILQAFDQASPLAANWLRNAFEAVADRQLRLKQPLPATELEAFVHDTAHDPRARRLAYDWLAKVDATAPKRLIPKMLLDPASEFRRDAVAVKISEAAKVDATKDKSQAIQLYREALSGAFDDDQVKAIAGSLDKLGEKVNISQHFAFINRYSAIGPFDNRGNRGLDAVYPPEREIQLNAEYDGQLGKVTWQPVEIQSDFGIVDIAKKIKPYKGAAMYFVAGFESATERPVELRLGTENAWKLWVNGQFLFSRSEYHRGIVIDQYHIPVTMRAGRNVILLKVCQNEQTEDWAQGYQFQLRVSDSNGRGIRSGDATAIGKR